MLAHVYILARPDQQSGTRAAQSELGLGRISLRASLSHIFLLLRHFCCARDEIRARDTVTKETSKHVALRMQLLSTRASFITPLFFLFILFFSFIFTSSVSRVIA